MKLAVFGLNAGIAYHPDVTMRLAARCEQLGYESWWAGEHVVLPSPRVAPAPMNPTDPILDPMIHLAFVAAATERMLLGTGIIILPQRNPLVLAKQIASLDAVSGGRFVFGVGVGYLEPEMSAIGVPLSERASRTDDHLAAMRTLWYGEAPLSFHGAHTNFDAIDAHPRPAGTIPIVIGGSTPGAHRRAVEQGHGWYGFFMDPDTVAKNVAALRAAQAQFSRPDDLGELEISVTPNGPLTAELVKAYIAAGVNRLIVYPLPLRDEGDITAFLEQHAAVVLG